VRTLWWVYAGLADAVVVLHFAFLAFVAGGGLLAWRWPWVIVPHLMAAGWGAVIIVYGVNCPLTRVENALRARAGEAELAGGFIDTYVEGVLYPRHFVAEARALAAVVVLASWIGLVVRHHHQHRHHRLRPGVQAARGATG